MTLSLNEIKNHERFEDLVASYFADLKNERVSNLIDIEVIPSGTGVDGGRDILIKLKCTDTISSYSRTWVVQCKYWNSSVSTKHIADINIPSLIHSYEASGYLLILKKRPTQKLTEHFEKLNQNCRFKYKYEIWPGEQLLRIILARSKKTI